MTERLSSLSIRAIAAGLFPSRCSLCASSCLFLYANERQLSWQNLRLRRTPRLALTKKVDPHSSQTHPRDSTSLEGYGGE